MPTPTDHPLAALLAEMRRIYAVARAATPGEAAGTLDRLLSALDGADGTAVPIRPPGAAGCRLPACRHLPAALEDAEAGAWPAAAAAFRALEPALSWMQNPNYTGGQGDAAFLENYGYCDFVGPRGLVETGDLAMGCLLMGPDLLYPDHFHPAVEVYVLLTGPAGWRLDGGAWREMPAGSLVYHASNRLHAMRAGAGPLLLAYAWLGALDVPASVAAPDGQGG